MNILFNDLPILQETKQAIEHLGLVETTSIQHHAIPKMLLGQDLIGQAQTGTGKTFAFAIPILEQIEVANANVQALIICPTRELTLQVYKEFIKLVKFNKDIRITSIYGGESYNKQFKALSQKPHIVVGTPGRVIDHLTRKTVDFNQLKVLVLDEADEMLKMGFQEDLETILKDTPSSRQTALFSATIPPFIRKVATKYQNKPEIIKIETPTLTVSKIDQFYYMVKKSERNALLIRLLDYYGPASALIFANTKKDVDDLSAFLQKNNYEADALHGDLKQSQRDYVLDRFRNKRLSFLIATDVAARGLDISHIDMVINYEIPFEDEIYVHRIGRTGRAGKSGVSISLVYPSMRQKLAMIERFIKTKMIELEIPTPEMIYQKQMDRTYQHLKQLIDNHQHDHQKWTDQLEQDGYQKDQIISALIGLHLEEEKQYEKIVYTASRRSDSNPKEFTRNSASKPKGPYRVVEVNLGKNDGIRPVTLLDYLKKHADLYPKNIGDIEVEAGKTTFQIHPAATKRLDQIAGKFYNGKKIRFQYSKK